MMKNLKIIALVAVFAGVLFYLMLAGKSAENTSRQGDYLWRASEMPEVIELASLRLHRKNGLWYVGEYYADPAKVEDFLSDLKQTVYLHKLATLPHCQLPLKLYAAAENILDVCLPDSDMAEVVIGKEGYAVSRDLRRSQQSSDWILQSLIPLADFRIEDGNLQELDFAKLDFTLATKEIALEKMVAKKLHLVTAEGLVIDGVLYQDGQTYWLQIKLDVTIMPQKRVAEFAKNNGFLYEGWYFKLPPAEGSRLFKALKAFD